MSVQSPDGRQRPAQLHAAGDRFALTYADTLQSGIYVAKFGPPANRSQTFAVNVDTAESDLAQIDPGRTCATRRGRTSRSSIRLRGKISREPAVGSARGKHGLHVDLLYAVLGLLLAETFLGWKLGARR